ncbi:YbgS-like family protein [Franconibacter sp. IITDAS19]|uniref:YbgS-like family protein n=1 Tax=Franconibacter sp. IITDAS19 TaxID=2930569 RepID=UPI001FFB9E52|nr:YbgS-like family protein [Franconibacter sp. IITDAS19]MCK1967309.1 YbgS-like family protein [Franconibacter sp. IITDAS19]
MNKLASLILTTTLTLASGAALAASGGAGGSSAGGSNGQSNQAADAGQVAPGAKENLAPNGVNNNNINSGSGTTGTTGSGTGTSSGAMGSGTGTSSSSNTNSGSTGTLSGDGMTTDEVHKNTMCKDGRCPDVNKKVETGSGNNNDVNTKTDGTTH